MTAPLPPTPPPGQSSDHDLLISINTKLDLVVGTVNSHSQALTVVNSTLAGHGERLVALETQNRSDQQHHERSISSRAAFWTAVGSIVLVLTLAATIWATHR